MRRNQLQSSSTLHCLPTSFMSPHGSHIVIVILNATHSNPHLPQPPSCHTCHTHHLATPATPTLFPHPHPCSIDESHRPVRLRKVVLGYPDSSSDFKFDLSLNYRLSGVIHTYSDDKPTLVVSDPHTPVQTRQIDVIYTDKVFGCLRSLPDTQVPALQ